ncbi:MAG TPA: serine/threonine-protein kinase, partial [Allocoleopsis sp.]
MLQAEIEPGTLVNNRYEIQRVLGQGGFGRTYLAYDVERFGELCVLKEFVPSIRTEYVIQKSRELFEREARVLYQLNHPQIPKFLAWFTHADGLFLVQEYIDGKTYASLLQQRQQRGQVFSQAEVVQWLKDLLSVLCYLHGRNIVHRDISPDNVILPYGQTQPVLIDFGLVKQQVSQVWASSPESLAGAGQHSFVGKFGYAPPEQIRMGHCHPYSDLYALAVTALVLLTGREPNWLIDQGSLEWKWRSYVTVSDYLAQMLDKMLAEKPRDRYQSAEEVLNYLQLYASSGTVATFESPIELQI